MDRDCFKHFNCGRLQKIKFPIYYSYGNNKVQL